MTDKDSVWSKCNECDRYTHQEVLSQERFDSDPDDYRHTDFYQIIRCNGCHNVSYRTESHDVEAGHEVPGLGWQVPLEITVFPNVSFNNRFKRKRLPSTIDDIYDEAITAFNQGALTLAGLGLRATIEAVCNEQEVKGKNLESRINKLATAGHVSKNDAKRLHAIRFLGNDAAHEVVKPREKSLRVALTIIEHLITAVYILDSDIGENLDRIIDNFDDFEQLLGQKSKAVPDASELPIKAILGKDMRRIDRNYDYAPDLQTAIGNGKCDYLSVGKIDSYNGSTDKIQHYIVKRT